MAQLGILLNKRWKIQLWLLASSTGIYFFYFHHLLLNPNSLLASLSSDALKNYYTYLYHIVNDKSMLHFEGMNYPFGEHVVYTDCQPLLTFLLRLLPFTHPYLVGILHLLIFFSYIITPLIIYNIFLRLKISPFTAFFTALAISVLSPQYWRLDGHFALTYECVIPIAILLLLKFFDNEPRSLYLILAYNTALFLLHPYLGFGVSIFCFLAILASGFSRFSFPAFFSMGLKAAIGGLLPVLLFKLFLFFTDQHHHRTQEPFGIEISLASFASVFVANFGPFMNFMKTYISNGPQEFEGLSYTGFFTVLMMAAFLLLIPFTFKKLKLTKEVSCLLIAALLLLCFSFGWHNQLLSAMGLHLSVFDQFRSLGRFAWFFYYVAPIFLASVFYHTTRALCSEKRFRIVAGSFAVLFFCFNMLEGNDMLKVYVDAAFKDKNVFRKDFLNAEEKTILTQVQNEKPQALLPLPVYFIGSEVYSRLGDGKAMLLSMLYSYHSALPIVGGSLSRTSITETENGIGLLNAYKRNRPAIDACSQQPFFVIKTNTESLPDEVRLFKKTDVFYKNDSAQFGFISARQLSNRDFSANAYMLKKNSTANADSNHVFYIHEENRKPYLPANINSYESALALDSNVLKTGYYIISLHYHFTNKTYKDVYNHLVITKTRGKEYAWEYGKAIRLFSGFYEGFAVFEYRFLLDSKNKYEFVLKGDMDKTYHISDFMIRPDTTDVLVILNERDTLLNNYPPGP